MGVREPGQQNTRGSSIRLQGIQSKTVGGPTEVCPRGTQEG